MNDWEKFNETSLPEKEDFYSQINLENITDANQRNAKRFVSFLKKIKVGKYQNFYFQSYTLLTADVFNNFQDICLEIYGGDSAQLFCARIGIASSLKKSK